METVFSVGSAPTLYNEDPRPAEMMMMRMIIIIIIIVPCGGEVEYFHRSPASQRRR
jgi:hypothetical protein